MEYVDDTSVAEIISKGEKGKIQSLIDEINTWCTENDMKLNRLKCKEMIITFAKGYPELDPIFVENYELIPVSSAKILGVHISADLKWNVHISHILTKASKRLYFLRLIKRSEVDHTSLLTVYTTCIRFVLEYGCQTWNFGIPQYLSEEVERIQRRDLRIIYPHLCYRQALKTIHLPTLSLRRDNLFKSHFNKLMNPNHQLHYLLSEKRDNNLRNNDNFTNFRCRTSRFKNSFIPSSVVLFNDT